MIEGPYFNIDATDDRELAKTIAGSHFNVEQQHAKAVARSPVGTGLMGT